MSWLVLLFYYSIFLTLAFAIYSSPSFLALERSAGFCIPKVGPVPAENLGEILHHEIGFRDAGSPDPNSATTSASFGASRLSFSFSLCVFLVSLSAKRNLSIFVFTIFLYRVPFSCLALPLARYASEHGPHGSTKELSKKEPKTRYDYEVQNRGKIHDLEHEPYEPRGWKSRNLSKSQLSVLGVRNSLASWCDSLLDSQRRTQFILGWILDTASLNRLSEGIFLKLTPLTREVLKFWCWHWRCHQFQGLQTVRSLLTLPFFVSSGEGRGRRILDRTLRCLGSPWSSRESERWQWKLWREIYPERYIFKFIW